MWLSPLSKIATLQLQNPLAVFETKLVDGHALTVSVHPDEGYVKVKPHNTDSADTGFISNSFPLQIHFYSTPQHINADKDNAADQT